LFAHFPNGNRAPTQQPKYQQPKQRHPAAGLYDNIPIVQAEEVGSGLDFAVSSSIDHMAGSIHSCFI